MQAINFQVNVFYLHFVLAMDVLDLSEDTSDYDWIDEGCCFPIRRCKSIFYFTHVAEYRRHYSKYHKLKF